MRIEHDAWSSAGLRPNNEDSYCVRPELGLYAVADGMGGYEGGELASALTVEALAVFFEENAIDEDSTWPFALLRTLSLGENLVRVACKAAHAAVSARKQGRFAQMGSTVATLHLREQEAFLGHVGDSRVYRLREGVLEQLTRDHSLYAELLAAGNRDLPDRASCGFGNVITRALGMPGSEPDLRQEPLREGDLFLLCTDGVTERLEDVELAELLHALPAEKPAAALCEEAVRRGSRDNVTAVIVRVLPCDQFALGVTLCELLTGARPWDGDSPLETMERVRAAAPPALPELDEDLRGLLLRCLARQPEARFPDEQGLLTELDACRRVRPGNLLELARLVERWATSPPTQGVENPKTS